MKESFGIIISCSSIYKERAPNLFKTSVSAGTMNRE